MEVDLFYRPAVSVALRLGNKFVYRLGVLPHLFRNVQMRKNMPNISHPRMMMVAMFVVVVVAVVVAMVVAVVVAVVVVVAVAVAVVVVVVEDIMAFFLFPMNRNRHMCTIDAAFGCRMRLKIHTGNVQSIHTLHELFRMGMKFQQCRCKHIACGAHIAF